MAFAGWWCLCRCVRALLLSQRWGSSPSTRAITRQNGISHPRRSQESRTICRVRRNLCHVWRSLFLYVSPRLATEEGGSSVTRAESFVHSPSFRPLSGEAQGGISGADTADRVCSGVRRRCVAIHREPSFQVAPSHIQAGGTQFHPHAFCELQWSSRPLLQRSVSWASSSSLL